MLESVVWLLMPRPDQARPLSHGNRHLSSTRKPDAGTGNYAMDESF